MLFSVGWYEMVWNWRQITNTRSSQSTYPGVHIQSPGLLQLTALRCVRQSYPKSSVRSGRRCSASHWSRTTRPYIAGFAAVALAALSSRLCIATYLRTSPTASGLRKSSAAATLLHRQIVCRSTHTQHIRWQELRSRRATCLEQSSCPLARRGHYIRQFQAWTQNVLF